MKTIDVRAWVVWLFAGTVVAIIVRNPLYLVILFVIARMVLRTCVDATHAEWRLPFWRLVIMILLFSTIFNVLIARSGDTVLWSFPVQWPIVGGDYTAEAALYGFINGLSLVVILAFFWTFNAVVPVGQLATLVPRALHEIGLVLLISITYVPETINQYHRIREAQAIRGHRLRGLRDLRPIVIPLLVGGLERAMNLAETMIARGYGSPVAQTSTLSTRMALGVGLILVLVGAMWIAWRGAGGWLIVGLGVAAVLLTFIFQRQKAERTYYRRRQWTWSDSMVIIMVASSLAILLVPIPGLERISLSYSAYPRLVLPAFEQWVGVALLGLASPALAMILP